jgi:hypothetical protein
VKEVDARGDVLAADADVEVVEERLGEGVRRGVEGGLTPERAVIAAADFARITRGSADEDEFDAAGLRGVL